MAITLPNVQIQFKQLANSFVQRSERGIVVLIIKDDTNKMTLPRFDGHTEWLV
ncbi:hypothetical protein [Ruminiclostridium cellulolyticum]|uniref:Uncharacterized protein n=1 Tax=Ruminiclostridium cellulolyticum (strain ATCC 35319 / DSM 5812 / JCM 6584 / H10) TaxID=394503 RepID=B8I8E5_RUMCH|nr:hypothetical protein [Ruminiclostridium cellulolyticum]ACL77245.1 hypothetical protein Ccel_2951 [Ruminiclostridium cellulolyticum H10]